MSDLLQGTAVALRPISKFDPVPKPSASAPDGWQLEDVEKDGGSNRQHRKIEKGNSGRVPKTKAPRNPKHSRIRDVSAATSKTSSFHDTKNLKVRLRIFLYFSS